MVQQVQLVQQKSDQQVVQIPPQALKVVQAASATLPPVPQRVPATPSVQVAPSEPTQVPQHLPFLLMGKTLNYSDRVVQLMPLMDLSN